MPILINIGLFETGEVPSLSKLFHDGPPDGHNWRILVSDLDPRDIPMIKAGLKF